MFFEVLGGLVVGALLSGRRRSNVCIERHESESRLPVYHPPLLPYVPSQRELMAVKHGHQFCQRTLRCACGVCITQYMGSIKQDICLFILRSYGAMKVIDIPCKNRRDGFGVGKLTTIVSKDLKDRVHQVERLHGVKLDHVLIENHRMRFIFREEDMSLADTRQTVPCR